jgi:hypothetical protein
LPVPIKKAFLLILETKHTGTQQKLRWGVNECSEDIVRGEKIGRSKK